MKSLRIPLVRNIFTIGAAAAVSQAVLLAFMPVLTRLYSPVAFGMFATFSALHATLLILFSLKYDIAILMPREDADAREAFALALFVPTMFALLLLVVLVANALFTERQNWFLLLLPASIIAASVYCVCQQWGARHRDYRHFAISQLVSTGVNVAVALVIGLVAPHVDEGLVLGFVGGLAAAALYMAATQSTGGPLRRIDWPTPSSLRRTAGKYRHMPLQVLPFTLLIVAMQSAPPLVLNAGYDLATIGLYAVAARVLLAPSSIIGGAIGEPFRAELAAKARSGEELAPITRKLVATLLALGAAIFALAYLLAPALFPILFGAEYGPSADLARMLCVGAFAQFIVLPITQSFVIAGHLRSGLVAQAGVALVPTMLLLLLSTDLPMGQALLGWSVAMAVCGGILVAMALRAVADPRGSPT